MRKIDQSIIRTQNLSMIYEAILREPMITRQKIAEQTGLSQMTVCNLVDVLNNYGAVDILKDEVQVVGRKKVGRKAEQLVLNEKLGEWLIIDLSVKCFQYCTITLSNMLHIQGDPWICNDNFNYSQNLHLFLESISEVIKEHNLNVLGIAVVTPGPYDAQEDRVKNTRIPELNVIHVKAIVKYVIGNYYLYVDEDVKFAARRQLMRFINKDIDIMYYLYIGEGVGGAVVHERKIIRGLNYTAGDPGQLPYNHGTFESSLSLGAFFRMLCIGNEFETPSVEYMHKAASLYPQRYRECLLDCAQTVAKLLINVIWLIDPQTIVVDCGYSSPLESDFIHRIEQCLVELSCKDLRVPEIFGTDMSMHAPYMGAVMMLEKWFIDRIGSTNGG